MDRDWNCAMYGFAYESCDASLGTTTGGHSHRREITLPRDLHHRPLANETTKYCQDEPIMPQNSRILWFRTRYFCSSVGEQHYDGILRMLGNLDS